MPVNRNALIRYKTIDKCLQNRYRKWTLEDLIDACSDALYEYEGIDKGVSKRTVQGDIQIMRSDKLGYNAPIIVSEKKYYTYEDPNYSITNIPLTDQDLNMLTDAVAFMKQFKGFSHFRQLDGMVQKLEDHIYAQKTQTKPVIDFEKNDNLKGLEHLDVLYQAIIKKQCLHLTYQSFKARAANSFDFHPYLLKEFRNRWFLIGEKDGATGIFNLALDRIIAIENSSIFYKENTNFDAATYFKDAIGVSISPNLSATEVLLYVNRYHAPYVLTKPLHHSQQLVDTDYYGITISLKVQLNFELEKAILGYGEGVKVLAPSRLKRKIKERLQTSVEQYNTDLTDKGLSIAQKKLNHKGFALLNYLYTQREIKQIGKYLHQKLEATLEQAPHRHLNTNLPNLKALILNKNVRRLLLHLNPNNKLISATYFHQAPTEERYQQWHQNGQVYVKEQAPIEGFTNWSTTPFPNALVPDSIAQQIYCLYIHLDDTTANNGRLEIMPGSHKKRHQSADIDLITSNSLSYTPDCYAGGVFLYNSLSLKRFTKATTKQRRRVLRLEFTAIDLPKPLEWLEAVELNVEQT